MATRPQPKPRQQLPKTLLEAAPKLAAQICEKGESAYVCDGDKPQKAMVVIVGFVDDLDNMKQATMEAVQAFAGYGFVHGAKAILAPQEAEIIDLSHL